MDPEEHGLRHLFGFAEEMQVEFPGLLGHSNSPRSLKEVKKEKQKNKLKLSAVLAKQVNQLSSQFVHSLNTFKVKKNNKTKNSDINLKIGKTLLSLGILLLIISYLPSIWFALIGDKGIASNAALIGETASETERERFQELYLKTLFQPPLDNNLPLENRIKILGTRIDTVINEAPESNFESALKKGVWRVSDFGSPYARNLPTILAAHRYGYLKWSVPYRLKNSFYQLPKVKKGDRIEIIWQQRKYIYEVYAEGKGDKIEDYSADLILYTCEDLNSPVRIFKYARLLQV